VTAETTADPVYCPEVHLCRYLDSRYPDEAPHGVHAYYARDFDVRTLSAFYAELVRDHDIDTIVFIDGGSDSLLAGDEADLGDPIEDITSVSAVSHLEGVPSKRLVSVGFGIDRYNGVSDAASLRALAELTWSDAFFVWPLMAQLFASDVEAVARRSIVGRAIPAKSSPSYRVPTRAKDQARPPNVAPD
jgi:hypothetical protein